ncbi:MAG: hypothetical protein Fur006_37640 [Coleofasciculaceae cyanobacterium]
MVEPAPKIDKRTAEDVAKQVQFLLAEYLPGEFRNPPNTGKPIELQGISAALVKIFARFSEIIIERLNQVPDKNFLAFLDLLGASRLPPQPARVPLTFSLASGSAVDAVVPAGTQVAAPPAEGQKEPVMFETERELVVTAAELVSIFTRNPQQDRYGDKSGITQPTSSSDVPAFEGNSAIAHILYIAHDTLLGYPDLQNLTLQFDLEQTIQNPNVRLQWEIWDGVEGIPIPSSSSNVASTQPSLNDTTGNLTNDGTVIFNNLPQIPQHTVFGIKSRWLRCRLLTPIVELVQLPSIKIINFQVRLQRSQLLPEKAFTNLLPVDLSKDFLPFGEKPKLGDTFYFADNNAFSKSGTALIKLYINLTDPASGISPPTPSNNLKLQWEFWNGTIWVAIGTSEFRPPSQPTGSSQFRAQSASSNTFNDLTRALTTSGTVEFTFPAQPVSTTINGIEGFWIRVRIVGGDYGKEAQYAPVTRSVTIKTTTGGTTVGGTTTGGTTTGGTTVGGTTTGGTTTGGTTTETTNQITEYAFTPATFKPPSINSLRIDYDWTTPKASPTVLKYNDFKYKNVTPVIEESSEFFQPFQPTQDIKPTLYLGFSLPSTRNRFPNRTLTLLFRLADVIYNPNLKHQQSSSTSPPRLVWQYWSGSGKTWEKLTVRDETEAFTRPGLVEFLPPKDFAAKSDFGLDKERYWLRVQWESGDYPVAPPKLRRVLLNTTMAAQTVTIRNETLGSSDGSEGQRFRTTQAPVLPGQQLQVRELELPAANEQNTIKKEEGEDAIATILDATGRPQEIWVRWHEVPDFYGSNSRDRHYVLDHLTGEIQFGNGLNGLIPPVGTGNVRMAYYGTGGGTAGNKPAGTIVQLKTTVPYIDKVTNTEAATGGADAEGLESLRDREPRKLRHNNRAVTLEDYEDLAILASPEVVRAKSVSLLNLLKNPLDVQNLQKSTPNAPGAVSIIIVPRATDATPVPSMELIDRVRDYLLAHSLPTVNVSVVGPLYISVNVKTEIVLTSLEGASSVVQTIEQKLASFLHPLTGGFNGTGWAFGRTPHKSDFYALLEAIPGVDYIRTLNLSESIPPVTLGEKDDNHQPDSDELQKMVVAIKDTGRFLVCSGKHAIDLF